MTASARQGLKQETSIWSRQRTTAVRTPLTTFVFPTYDTMFIPYRTFSSMYVILFEPWFVFWRDEVEFKYP